jgi:hypothetical protein
MVIAIKYGEADNNSKTPTPIQLAELKGGLLAPARSPRSFFFIRGRFGSKTVAVNQQPGRD